MKKALVTGGAGFIGSHLVDRLVSEGWAVRILDNFSSGTMENIAQHKRTEMVEVLNVDLKNFRDVNKAVEDVHVVFHYAANPEVRVSTTNPEVHFNENVAVTFNLLEALRQKNVKELVFASSSSVYGEPEELPISENASVKPVSVYGASKAACENLIHAYSQLYGVKAVLLRYANVVGPRLRHGVIYDLMMKLKKNPYHLEILGDGTQTRSYIYINDAVEATLAAYARSNSNFEVYNVGSEDWITVKDLVQILLRALRIEDIKISYKPILHGVGWLGDVKRVALKIDKLARTGFKPKMNSVQAVEETIKHLHESIFNPANYN